MWNMMDKYLVYNVPHEGEGTGGGTGDPPPAWHAGLEADLVGHAQNRGWDKLDPAKAAQEALKAHREAEKMIGIPADRVLKLPADKTNEAEWKSIWQRLGVPVDAKEYDFSTVKNAKGEPIAPALADAIRAEAFAANVPKDAVSRVAAAVVKHLDATQTEAAAVAAGKLAEEKAALNTNWGANRDANMIVARQGAAKLGITPEEVQALESVIGYAKVMETFRKVGAATGEAPFIASGGTKDGSGVMSKEQAVARKTELMGDKEWAKRYLDGGVAEKREMTALNTLIAGPSV